MSEVTVTSEQPVAETTAAEPKTEAVDAADAAVADAAPVEGEEGATAAEGADAADANKPEWVQSLEEKVLAPVKAGAEKAAQETKRAFEDAGKKIEEEIARSKAPGGVFAKETYVELGSKIKEAFEGVGTKLRSISGSAPAETDEAAMEAAAAAADAPATDEGAAAASEAEAAPAVPAAADASQEETV